MKNILLILFALLIIDCAGSRATIKLEKSVFPVSMSAFLFDANGNVLVKTRDLKVVGNFEYQKRFWGIFWSYGNFSDDSDISEAINKEIQAKNGDGLINFTVESDWCLINTIPILGMLPFWPGCTIAKIKAEIIKAEQK